ncbi:hypothetical protein [Mariniphaga sediminis]|uniref:hypothetical protein n=1 Tax=Mariniphaga sediminis TaxID=1628158 RepID=UPI00356612D4
METTPILFEKFSWLLSDTFISVFPWVVLAWIIHLMSRIPEDIHWLHEYEIPKEYNRVRKGIFPTLVIYLFALGAIWLAWIAVPDAVGRYSQLIREGIFWEYVFSSPWLIIGSSLILAEVYLGIAFAGGFLQLAQSDVPTVPKWLLDIGIILFIIFTIAVEIATLPATWPAAIIVLLASVVFILFAGWSLWASFPNTPMRVFFCTKLVPYHHSPFVVFWDSFWGCLKWVWKTAVKIWKEWYNLYQKVVLSIPKQVYKTIFVQRPVTRLVRKLVPVVPAWVPNWLRKAGNYVLDYVDTLVEVVEYILVAVVVAVIIFVTMIVYVVVTVVIFMIAFYVTLVCLVWGVILFVVAFYVFFYWWVPMWVLRLFFFN